VGFCLSAVIALHGASVVNTLGHRVGSQRYPTGDGSRNSFLLAVLSFGDGWHNNHHHYPHAAQAGFFWWEADSSFRLIRLLERVGLVWDVRRVPPHKLQPPAPPAPTPTPLGEVADSGGSGIRESARAGAGHHGMGGPIEGESLQG
jgi:hypothetical protein